MCERSAITLDDIKVAGKASVDRDNTMNSVKLVGKVSVGIQTLGDIKLFGEASVDRDMLDDIKPAGKVPVHTDAPDNKCAFTVDEDVDLEMFKVLYHDASKILGSGKASADTDTLDDNIKVVETDAPDDIKLVGKVSVYTSTSDDIRLTGKAGPMETDALDDIKFVGKACVDMGTRDDMKLAGRAPGSHCDFKGFDEDEDLQTLRALYRGVSTILRSGEELVDTDTLDDNIKVQGKVPVEMDVLDDIKLVGKASVEMDTPDDVKLAGMAPDGRRDRDFRGFDEDEDDDLEALGLLYDVASKVHRFSWVEGGP
jgi:cytoskeletal protein CcmA (bactofilin family)